MDITRSGEMLTEEVTDDAGQFRFDNVPTGPLELTLRLINFSIVRRAINVPAGGTLKADVIMQVAASADTVITAPSTFRNLAEIENPAENLVGIASGGVAVGRGPQGPRVA